MRNEGEPTLETVISKQNVRLASGRHSSPAEGACVVELASLLAGERFSDRPLSVCPVLGAYMRVLNDRLGDRSRQALLACAAELVGSRDRWKVRRRRARACARWADEMDSQRRWRRMVLALQPEVAVERCAVLASHRGVGLELGMALIRMGGTGAEPVRSWRDTATGEPGGQQADRMQAFGAATPLPG